MLWENDCGIGPVGPTTRLLCPYQTNIPKKNTPFKIKDSESVQDFF
eukprot:UN08207